MDFSSKKSFNDMDIYRYKGKWYKVNPKPYEPERQTNEVAWLQIREPLVSKEEAYRQYYEKKRIDSKILYPSFRKDDK